MFDASLPSIIVIIHYNITVLTCKYYKQDALQNIRHLYDIGMRYDKPKTLLLLQFS
jgi:hypothetical protein